MIDEISSEKSPTWYALRTFNCKELKVSEFLTASGREHFIPMAYAEKQLRDSKPKRVLVPVVHNLIFLKKDAPQKEILQLLAGCPVPVTVFRHEGNSDCYEIPDREMLEFRLLCDPEFEGSIFLTKEEADARPGREVRIVHGPFSGICGKLHRMNKTYFFIKTLADVGVMVRIPRVFCQVIE